MKISVSILGTTDLIKSIKKLNETDADFLHLDIMDGKFVKNKSLPFGSINKIVSNATKKLDVHLMVSNPDKYIDDYGLLNTDCITIHSEIKNIDKHLKKIKSYGLKTGLSINPNTNVEAIKPYLNQIDRVLIMSVNPGLPGQTIITSTLDKISESRDINPNITIALDGGINDTNIEEIKTYNPDIVCVGTFITNYEDYKEQIKKIRG